MFTALEVGIARLSALPQCTSVPPLDDVDDTTAMVDFLRKLAADAYVREALTVSSASLGHTLARVADGVSVEPKRLRRAVLAAIRYVSRMSHRPTPFGLLAGVCRLRFGDATDTRVGTAHRRQVRVDMGWLVDVVRPMETDPTVLEKLRLVANDQCFGRGDRLVLPMVRDEIERRGPDDREHTVRLTNAVRTAMAAASSPVGYPELVKRLHADFPAATETEVTTMVTELVRREFLLTDLRPSATCTDPLSHVAQRLPEMASVKRALEEYARTSVGAGAAAWSRSTEALRRWKTADRMIQVDLGMDADVVIPAAVADELVEAAAVAWRLTPAQLAPADPLAGFRAEFIERYGTNVLVPVKEVLNPTTGLGAPPGYLLPPSSRRAVELETGSAQRDELLFQLAWGSGREIVLDEELVERLGRTDRADEPPPYLEACVQVLADSTDSLAGGDFRLVAGSANFNRPGAMFGRFLHLLPELATPMSQLATELAGDATPTQLCGPLTQSRTFNVSQVPRLTEQSLEVGVFADRANALSLDEVLVGADHRRFFLVSTRDGRRISPQPFHALNPLLSMPNAVRFLLEVGQADTPPWPLWTWGAADRLPYLPRVRHGRTVLSSARWQLDPRLKTERSWTRWRPAFERWRKEWDVPDRVYAVSSDNRVLVDLTEPAQLRMLHDDLRKRPATALQEEPAGGEIGTGWIGGHANEIVIPLVPRRVADRRPVGAPRDCWGTEARDSRAQTPPFGSRLSRTSVPQQSLSRHATAARSYPPGSEWLYAKVFADPGRHAELLSRHLPALVGRLTGVDRWFFLRYREDGAQLRIRFHGDPADLNGTVLPMLAAWSADLTEAGIVGNLTLDTYRPEYQRYGGSSAIEAAEHLFRADSESVLTQLRLREQGQLDLPVEILLAANHIDLVRWIHGDGWWEFLLSAYPKGDRHATFQEHRRAAMRLLDPLGGWKELAAMPGGPQLLESWAQRASAAADYGQLLRAQDTDLAGPISSILHLHHNRLVGIDRGREQDGYAVARGTLQAQADRDRHLRKSGRNR
ncbi:lantibiotic dehydratase [Fodinicola acaciae]|uniref:lantibiotic dehydratase n=1 Tax=Fodinicola acaciae TaxID=2681555 RepID=UPI0013D6E3E5|nr:lantibiotic dehydratase [Fodinicola acaciae]